jgi:hypothetical protein
MKIKVKSDSVFYKEVEVMIDDFTKMRQMIENIA